MKTPLKDQPLRVRQLARALVKKKLSSSTTISKPDLARRLSSVPKASLRFEDFTGVIVEPGLRYLVPLSGPTSAPAHAVTRRILGGGGKL